MFNVNNNDTKNGSIAIILMSLLKNYTFWLIFFIVDFEYVFVHCDRYY